MELFLPASDASQIVRSPVAQPSRGDGLWRALLLWLATAAVLGATGIVVWRPFGTDAGLHNALTIGLLLTSGLALGGVACLVRSAADWALLAAHATIAGFLVRCVPNLLLGTPPLHDGYYYYVSALNILDQHSFQPVLGWWYNDVARQLHWPMLQHLTAQIHLWSGIPNDTLWRFLPPALGALTFLAVGLLAYQAYPDWRIAAIAGLLGSLSDLVIYYQAEYHPQGLGIVIFAFLIFMLLASRMIQSLGLRLLLLLVGAAFLYSHHASTLMLPFMLATLLLGPWLARVWRWLIGGGAQVGRLAKAGSALAQQAALLAVFESALLLLLVASVTRHLYLSTDVLDLATRSLDPFSWMQRALPPSGPSFWLINLLRNSKYIVLGLGAVGVLAALRRPHASTLVLVLLALGLFVAGTAVSFVMHEATTRLLAVWYTFIAIFAAITLHLLCRAPGLRGRLGAGFVVLTIAAYTTAGTLNSQVPAVFLVGTPRSAGAWYGNALPRSDRMALAGRWLGIHTPPQSRVAADFATRMAPFFYGHRPDSDTIYRVRQSADYCSAQYIVVDYSLDDGELLQPHVTLDYRRYPRIYDNGSIAIFQPLKGMPCAAASAPPVDQATDNGQRATGNGQQMRQAHYWLSAIGYRLGGL